MFSYFLKCTLIDENGNYFAMQNMACKTFTIAIAPNCEITGCVEKQGGGESFVIVGKKKMKKRSYIIVAQQQHGHNNKRIVKFYSFFVWRVWGDTSLGHFLIIKENDFFVH